MSKIWRGLASLSLLSIPLTRRAERQYRQLPDLPRTTNTKSLPHLSIIIPARNEAENLQALLPTLNRLDYPGLREIIVVDDHSEDETAVVARAHGATVMSAPPLPASWRGKPHACHNGAAAAQGEWLLFTDADTRHAPHSARDAVHTCQVNGFDGLSLFLGQENGVCCDLLLLAAAFGGLFAGVTEKMPLINGQYILIKKSVYEESGGFAAVRTEMIEDVALAHHLAAAGRHLPIFRGEKAGSVRMYGSVAQMWHGLTRLGAGSLKWAGHGRWLTTAYITAVMSPFIALLGFLRGALSMKWVVGMWTAVAFSSVKWIRRFGSPLFAPLIPFGALFIQIAASFGLLTRLSGKTIKWKGRAV